MRNLFIFAIAYLMLFFILGFVGFNEVAHTLLLDENYLNEKFHFQVYYPSEWKMIEEDKPSLGENSSQGIYICVKKNEENYMSVYGQTSGIAIPESGMTTESFITNQYVGGTQYYRITDNVIDKYIVIGEFYCIYIHMDNEIYKKNEKTIVRICKSFIITE